MDNREPIDRIKALIPSLPEGDAKLAHKFLNSRDFESLQLLVDSSLVRVKKGLSKENPKEEYLKADLGEMRKLKSEIDTYCEALELPEQEDEYEDRLRQSPRLFGADPAAVRQKDGLKDSGGRLFPRLLPSDKPSAFGRRGNATGRTEKPLQAPFPAAQGPADLSGKPSGEETLPSFLEKSPARRSCQSSGERAVRRKDPAGSFWV